MAPLPSRTLPLLAPLTLASCIWHEQSRLLHVKSLLLKNILTTLKIRIVYLIEFFIVIIVTDRKCSVADNVVLATILKISLYIDIEFLVYSIGGIVPRPKHGEVILGTVTTFRCPSKSLDSDIVLSTRLSQLLSLVERASHEISRPVKFLFTYFCLHLAKKHKAEMKAFRKLTKRS